MGANFARHLPPVHGAMWVIQCSPSRTAGKVAAQAQRALSLWCLLGVLRNAAWLTSFAGQRGRVTLCGGADKRPGVNFVCAAANVEWRLRTFPPLGEVQKSTLELVVLI